MDGKRALAIIHGNGIDIEDEGRRRESGNGKRAAAGQDKNNLVIFHPHFGDNLLRTGHHVPNLFPCLSVIGRVIPPSVLYLEFGRDCRSANPVPVSVQEPVSTNLPVPLAVFTLCHSDERSVLAFSAIQAIHRNGAVLVKLNRVTDYYPLTLNRRKILYIVSLLKSFNGGL